MLAFVPIGFALSDSTSMKSSLGSRSEKSEVFLPATDTGGISDYFNAPNAQTQDEACTLISSDDADADSAAASRIFHNMFQSLCGAGNPNLAALRKDQFVQDVDLQVIAVITNNFLKLSENANNVVLFIFITFSSPYKNISGYSRKAKTSIAIVPDQKHSCV